jgi:hypothetical protein
MSFADIVAAGLDRLAVDEIDAPSQQSFQRPLEVRVEKPSVVMPALVAGIHVLAAERAKDGDGRNKSGHDGVRRGRLQC